MGGFLDFPPSDPSFNKENNFGSELLLKMEVFINGNIVFQNLQEWGFLSFRYLVSWGIFFFHSYLNSFELGLFAVAEKSSLCYICYGQLFATKSDYYYYFFYLKSMAENHWWTLLISFLQLEGEAHSWVRRIICFTFRIIWLSLWFWNLYQSN